LSIVDREFFQRPVDEVALDLVGRDLIVSRSTEYHVATIIETEAYGGPDDPASHAAFKPGGGAKIMFGEAGLIYVYMAYGMYPCLNIVTGSTGDASAVLIRGAIVGGAEQRLISGPGRLGRHIGVSMTDNGEACPGPAFQISSNRHEFHVDQTPRIGITRGVDTLWRFHARIE
jgi:DNA-3-methyladenine glycosylase